MQVCYSRDRKGKEAAAGKAEQRGKQGSGDPAHMRRDTVRQESNCPHMLIFVGSPGALLRAAEVTFL